MFKKIKNLFVLIIVLTYLLFEELIWDKIVVKIYNLIAKLKLYESFLDYIRLSANRYVVLIFFILPFIIGEILGIISAILIAKIHIFLAISVYALKIPIIVLAFSILKSGKEKLDSFIWFVVIYSFIERAVVKVKNSNIYIRLKERAVVIKEYIHRARNRLLDI